MPMDKFVAHMTTIMMGAVNGTGELVGVVIDPPDQPISSAVKLQQIDLRA